MTQRMCEVCGDPLPLESTETICDNCQSAIDIEIGLINEESAGCETSANAEETSSSGTPVEITPEQEQDKSTSESSDVPSVAVASPFDALDLELGLSPIPTPIVERTEQVEESPLQQGIDQAIHEAQQVKPEEPTACECCGFIQKPLKPFKHPHVKEPMLMCDKCFADEVALVNAKDDPMQGKIVHPDEAERDEIMSMDEEDRVLYNEEVLINAASPLEQVHARIELLERRLARAKIQAKAAKRTLTMRVENLDKKAKDEEYRKMGERLAARKRRAQGDASGGAPKAKKQRAPGRSKAQQFRDSMKANGFSDAWIDEQIKKMGLED